MSKPNDAKPTEQPNDEVILVENVFGYKTRQPFVGLRWGRNYCQMTPAEARAHALLILECAEAAEQDAFLIKFMTDTVGANVADAAMLLSEFRSQRGKFNDSQGTSG